MVRDYAIDDAARSLDQEQTLKWIRGWQVVDPEGGSNLVTAGTGDFEFDAAAGDISAGGTTVACSLETVDFQADIDPSDDKLAVIYRDASGTLQKAVGSGGTRDPAGDDVQSTFAPAPPTLSNTDAVILAEVLLPAGASSIGSAELHDRRDPAEFVANTFTAQDATVANAPTASTDVARKAETDANADDPHGNAAHSPDMVEQGGPLNETLDANSQDIDDIDKAEVVTLDVTDVNEPIGDTTADPASGTVTVDLQKGNVWELEAIDDIDIDIYTATADRRNSLITYINDSDAGGPYNVTHQNDTVEWSGNQTVSEVGASSDVEIAYVSYDAGGTWKARESGADFE